MAEDVDLLQGVGAAIAAHRRAAGVTQLSLAERIGKSVQWISAVEQGRRRAERLTDLIRIASVLGCTVDDLIGRPLDTLAPGAGPSQAETVTALREVVMRSARPVPAADSAPDAADVARRVDDAWTIWHESPTAHRRVGALLPALVADAHAAHAAHAASSNRRSACVLSAAYQITRQWLHHVPSGALAWVVSERAVQAAQEADDPYLMAMSAWALSAPYRRAGHPDEATRLCLAAADEVHARIDPVAPRKEHLAAYGMLHLTAAVSAAQSDQDGRAWALHQSARDAAIALGPGYYDPWTKFGIANVDIHGVALQAELGRSDDVVELSARLRLDAMPSVQRRSSSLITTARGYVRRGEDEAAALVLLDAEQISSDNVHGSTTVREMLRELIVRDRARARSHVRGLATRSGLIAA
ncbi:hypothetical protein GCM10027059_37530 [Myceligenerans halotolerans]